MEKLYRVVITEIDPETKAEKEVHVDELYKNVYRLMLGQVLLLLLIAYQPPPIKVTISI